MTIGYMKIVSILLLALLIDLIWNSVFDIYQATEDKASTNIPQEISLAICYFLVVISGIRVIWFTFSIIIIQKTMQPNWNLWFCFITTFIIKNDIFLSRKVFLNCWTVLKPWHIKERKGYPNTVINVRTQTNLTHRQIYGRLICIQKCKTGNTLFQFRERWKIYGA